jgi:hypothetical protein
MTRKTACAFCGRDRYITAELMGVEHRQKLLSSRGIDQTKLTDRQRAALDRAGDAPVCAKCWAREIGELPLMAKER